MYFSYNGMASKFYNRTNTKRMSTDKKQNANVLIRGATVEENTALEYICTVAATYGCKILRANEYDANEYG